MAQFHEALALAIKEAGFTNSELARRTGVHKSSVTCWLKGRNIPRGPQFARLVKVLPALKDVFDDPAA